MARRFEVFERGKLVRGLRAGSDELDNRQLPEDVFDQLKRQEQEREARGETAVFKWGSRGGIEHATVGKWVGVIAVGKVQIELLPKIERRDERGLRTRPSLQSPDGGRELETIRGNLLEMLAYSGQVPIRVRGQAALAMRRAPLQDAIAGFFLDQLVTELSRGEPRAYQAIEEELGTVRGRLMVQRQITRNAATPHRLWCAYESLELDARIAGRFHHACRILAREGVAGRGRRTLSQALMMLADAPPEAPPGKPVGFDRQNERFRDVYDFAGQIIDQNAPDPRSGATRGFSLVYDIDRLFEAFVLGFLRREVIGHEKYPWLAGWTLDPQGMGERRFLMHRDAPRDKGVLHLKPDLLFCKGDSRIVADTKWYDLAPHTDARPSREVLYQLYAYLNEFDCARAVLLYPWSEDFPRPGASEVPTFRLADRWGDKRLSMAWINLSIDLSKPDDRRALADRLAQVLADLLPSNDARTIVSTPNALTS